MEIKRITFTGGPCSGKSTFVEMLKNDLIKEGYNVICIGESATELSIEGIEFSLLNNELYYQDLILDQQIFKENIVDEVLKRSNKDYVIIYDRGIMDNKAYFSNSDNFDYMMKKNAKNELECLDKYDIVFDLLSTATCAPEKYNLLSNKARRESLSEAQALDIKTSNAWAGHRNLFVFSSDMTMEEEYKEIKNKVDEYLNNNIQKKTKKININNKLEDFDNYNDNNSRLINVCETTLKSEKKDINYKIYKRTYKNITTYFLECIKSKLGNEKIIFSTKIDSNTYLEFINKYKLKTMEEYKLLSFIKDKVFMNIKFYKDNTTLEYEDCKLSKNVTLPEEVNIDNKKSLLKIRKYGTIKE